MKTRKQISIILIFLMVVNTVLYSQETKESDEYKLAINLYNDNMFDLALDQFKNFVNAYPGSNQAIEARYYIGLVQFKLKKFEEARVSFQNFALSYTDNSKAADAWFKVGESYVALKNFREAALAFERVKVFQPKSQLAPEALFKSAEYFTKDGDLTNARKNLQAIMQDYSGSDLVQAARLSLAELYLEDGNVDLAQSEARRVMNTESKYKPAGLILLGRIYVTLGQFDEAEKNLLTVIKNYKNSSNALQANFELGMMYKQSKDFTKAVSEFEKIVNDKIADVSFRESANFELGLSYYELKDFKSASKYFENLIQSFPESEWLGEVMLWAGKSRARANNFKAALSWYDKILATKKSDDISAHALIQASYSAEKSGSVSLAIEYYKRFLQKFPDHSGNAEASVRVADLLRDELKDYQQAIKYYEEAIHILEQRSPESLQRKMISSLKLKIAECYSTSGYNEYAINNYKEIIKNFPSDREALEAIQRLEAIKTLSGKDYKVGMEKIAKLIGDLLTDKPKGDVAYNLAEVYYNDLKDFVSAADYYSLALNKGIDTKKAKSAAYCRANALAQFSQFDTSFADHAVDYLEYYLANYPIDEKSDEVKYKLLTLKVKSSALDSEKLLRDFISSNPKSNFVPSTLKQLGDNYYLSKNYNDATPTYQRILKEYPNSDVAEYANFQIGKIYFESGSNDSCIATFSKIIDKYPNSIYTAGAMKMLADAFINQTQYNEAVKIIQQLTEQFYYTQVLDGVDVLYSKALIGSNNYDKAINILKTIIDDSKNNPFVEKMDYELKLSLAQAYDKKGESQKAIPLYHEYLKNADTNVKFSDVYVALGNIAKAQGANETATVYYKLAGSSGNPKALKDIADLLFQNGRYHEAEKYYKDLLQNAPNDDDKKYFQSRIIVCKLKRDDLKEAEPLITDFSKKYKKAVEYLAEFDYEKGLHFYRNQDLTHAKKIFEAVADDYDKTEYCPLSEYYLGKILENNKKLPDAIKKYESILKKYPNSNAGPRVLLALGNINYSAEKYEDAIRYYQSIVESPEKAGDMLLFAMTNLIQAYESTKLYDAALKLTRNFIERYPKDSSVVDKRIKIGILYTRLEYYDQAILHFQTLLDQVGSEYEAEIRYNFGETYYYKGDYQQAILEFLKVPYLANAKGVENWTATAFYMAGQAYERMGKYDKALSMYQQIIDRPGIDVNFKAGARKEIDRVKSIIK
jgi:TolA-binding protein